MLSNGCAEGRRICPASHEVRGFSLTEVAVVLGVLGIVLGAIWSAAFSVYENHKIAQAVQELQVIVSNIRALYATNPAFEQTTPLNDITAPLMVAGVFPSNMIVPGSAWPQNPWGGAVAIFVVPNFPGSDNTQFEVEFYPTPAPANSTDHTIPCAMMFARTTGPNQDSGLLWVWDDKGGWNPHDASGGNLKLSDFDDCVGNIAWVYKLKP